jgi:predicted metal-dependent hydrolase
MASRSDVSSPQQLSLFEMIEAALPSLPFFGRKAGGGGDADGVGPRAQPPLPVPATGHGPAHRPTPPSASPKPPAKAPAPVGSVLPPHASARATHQIMLGPCRVSYRLRRAQRKSIGFVIGPDGLAVSAPRWVGHGDIEQALQAKSSWILRKLAEQRERQQRLESARVEWRDGGCLPYLGEPLRLQLLPAGRGGHWVAQAQPDAEGVRQILQLGLPVTADASQIRDMVHAWMQQQARSLFEQRCQHFAQRLGVQMRRLRLSGAQTRWGSASADGSIRLNWRLMQFSLPVIDYVVAHELAHLREMNHSPAFWAVVQSVIPDMDERKAQLRTPALPLTD